MKKIVYGLVSLFFLLATSVFKNPVLAGSPPIGNYLEFSGGYLKTSSIIPKPLPAFSFEVWIKPLSVSGIQPILSVGDKNNGLPNLEISINGGSLSLWYKYNISSYKLMASGKIDPNVWTHIAATISSADTKLFINGSQLNSIAGTDNLSSLGSDIIMGNSYLETAFPNNLYQGSLDEVRISNIARNVKSLWDSGAYNQSLKPDANTLILWNLDEIRGQTEALDSSESKLNASLIGGDGNIHFYGIVPTPTSFALPFIHWTRPVLPTFSIPSRISLPGSEPVILPTISVQPAPTDVQTRKTLRPVLPR